MRAVLPKEVPMKNVVHNCAMGASLVAAILTGDIKLLGAALDQDSIIEPARKGLIPGFSAVKEAAKAAGAYGCTISGAGPTAVAVVDNMETGNAVMQAMSEAFVTHGGLEVAFVEVCPLDQIGARTIE
eukprot:TRINITY_DN35053_c1_g1_i1.p3 TRINITY_DN35053_c1_g1~~TRINITY_DN35053_c1_g1_i1.p3  ORF type:complete len:147 (-),score=31.91 TRINITY_DN35053_c1_g1_i1:413-796(-)